MTNHKRTQRRDALRAWRKANPIHAAYLNLKHNAKRRGKIFNLTLVEFEKFCAETDYQRGKGRKSTSLHVDRINEDGPYSLNNIQTLENAKNVRKYVAYKGRDINGKVELTTITVKPVKIPENCPY
jgi:hypothetical protein